MHFNSGIIGLSLLVSYSAGDAHTYAYPFALLSISFANYIQILLLEYFMKDKSLLVKFIVLHMQYHPVFTEGLGSS